MTTSADTPSLRHVGRRLALGVVAAIVTASLLNLAIAAVAHAAGTSDDFAPLQPGAFIFFTALGTFGAAAGWAVVRRLPRGPGAMRTLLPAVLAVSLVPDLLVGVADSMAGTSWTGVIALMAMHVVVAAVVVTMLAWALPLKRE